MSTVNRRIGGFRTCGGLSPLGRQQAERLRDRLTATGELAADVLYSSQFPRARETAELISPALGGLEVHEHEGFGEHDPGADCDGLRFDEFVERFGQRDWEGDPFGETFPGGETIAAFHYRVGLALYDVLQRHPGRTIVVACHGGVVDATFRQLLRAPSTGNFQLHTLNTAITEFRSVPLRSWQLLRYNDAAHLAGLPAETPR